MTDVMKGTDSDLKFEQIATVTVKTEGSNGLGYGHSRGPSHRDRDRRFYTTANMAQLKSLPNYI